MEPAAGLRPVAGEKQGRSLRDGFDQQGQSGRRRAARPESARRPGEQRSPAVGAIDQAEGKTVRERQLTVATSSGYFSCRKSASRSIEASASVATSSLPI